MAKLPKEGAPARLKRGSKPRDRENKILPRLYIGGLRAARAARDYDLVVNLSGLNVRRNHPARIPTLVWPISDSSTIPNKDALWAIARHVTDVLRRSKESRVLVHCSAGRNRSALLCAAVVMLMRDVTGPEAIRHVRDKRQGALGNPSFERWLSKQKSVKERYR